MEKLDLILKLNAEQLLMRVARYNSLVHYGAPEVVRASELRMILESMCKAVDATNQGPIEPGKTSIKEFFKEDVLETWSKYSDEFFNGAKENDLEDLAFQVDRALARRANGINKFIAWEKEQEELETLHKQNNITDIEKYKFKKELEEDDLF